MRWPAVLALFVATAAFAVPDAGAVAQPYAVKTRVHRARRLLQKSLSNEMSSALDDVYHFGGARCDRLVAAVFRRLNTGS